MRRVLIACTAAVLGCGADLAQPRILELTPGTMLASDAPEVTLRLDGVLPYEIDYGRSSVNVDTDVTVAVGSEALGRAVYRPEGAVLLRVPSAFAPGRYPVTVGFADGRVTTAPALFEVTAGDWPSSYTIAAVGPQRVGEPFELRLEAQRGGLPLGTFRGTVDLSLQDGSALVPMRTEPFTGGQLIVRMVTVSTAGNHAVVLRDANGTTVVSNTFGVAP